MCVNVTNQTYEIPSWPSSSSDWSALAVDDRFQRKLRNGLFERDRRLTLADDDWLRFNEESPLRGVVGGDDRALSSAEVVKGFISKSFYV